MSLLLSCPAAVPLSKRHLEFLSAYVPGPLIPNSMPTAVSMDVMNGGEAFPIETSPFLWLSSQCWVIGSRKSSTLPAVQGPVLQYCSSIPEGWSGSGAGNGEEEKSHPIGCRTACLLSSKRCAVFLLHRARSPLVVDFPLACVSLSKNVHRRKTHMAVLDLLTAYKRPDLFPACLTLRKLPVSG